MRWKFWESDSDLEQAEEELRSAIKTNERAKELRKEMKSSAERLKELNDSNGFAEAVAALYRAKPKTKNGHA